MKYLNIPKAYRSQANDKADLFLFKLLPQHFEDISLNKNRNIVHKHKHESLYYQNMAKKHDFDLGCEIVI